MKNLENRVTFGWRDDIPPLNRVRSSEYEFLYELLEKMGPEGSKLRFIGDPADIYKIQNASTTWSRNTKPEGFKIRTWSKRVKHTSAPAHVELWIFAVPHDWEVDTVSNGGRDG